MPNAQNSKLNSHSLPRNIYSFSSAKAKRDLSFRPLQRNATPKPRPSLSESAPLKTQIELFEQDNLFGPDFDVVEELETNKERYTAYGDAKEQITSYGVPTIVSYNLDRIERRL